MKYIWKNSIRRMLPAGIGLFLLCLIFPKLTGYAPLDALRALYGGVPLGRLTVQAGFFFTFSLLQYCGWLGLSCLLKNETNLLPRWQSRGKLLAALWRFLLPTDLLFVLTATAGTLAGLCGGVLVSASTEIFGGVSAVAARLGGVWAAAPTRICGSVSTGAARLCSVWAAAPTRICGSISAGAAAGLGGGTWASAPAMLRGSIPSWVSAGLYGCFPPSVLAELRSCISAGTLQELAEISVRGLIECIFLSGLQLFFLVRLGEERTAIAMTATAVGMTLISLSPMRLVWLAPAKTPFLAVSFVTGICLAIGAARLGKKASLRDIW
ncbi:MAG: hypothetical protein NC541_15050 [bacterium]|nr:hypothetical protein [bacterium]